MGRPIKFRGWFAEGSYEANEHYRPAMVYQDGEEDFDHFTVEYTDDSGATPVVWSNEECQIVPVMQYTGLKDKNGRDIYEGDVLEHRIAMTSKTKREVVKWFAGEDPDGHPATGFTLPYEEVTVIGNIYENEELIP